MSPRVSTAEDRTRCAPVDRQLVEQLFALAGAYECLLGEHVEVLDYATYDNLVGYETKLLALGSLLASDDPTALVRETLDEADDFLAYAKLRIGGAS